MKIAIGILLLVVLAWTAYGYIAVRGIEEPAFSIADTRAGYVVRSYDTYIVAEARVTKPDLRSALNAGFTLIADYIFGNNTAAAPIAMTAPVGESPAMSENIAMTVPVSETQLGTDRVISFVMPSKYTLASIPKPKNTDVVLREVPAHRVAVLSFSWSASQSNVDAKKAALLTLVEKDGLEPQGPAEAKFYNPPWTPPFFATKRDPYTR